jgi:hypothetical protein
MEGGVMASVESLLDASEMAEKIRGRVSADRLNELAASGLIPHYDVDGSVMVGVMETKEWINHNLVARMPGRHIGNSIVTVVDIMTPGKNSHLIPVEIATIAASLIPISLQSAESVPLSGVYFLCHEAKVVYVGQSGNVFQRVGCHLGVKTFDSVWFMRVPVSDLDFVEGELIRTLSPKYNITKGGRLVGPRTSSVKCKESIDSVRAVSALSEENPDA